MGILSDIADFLCDVFDIFCSEPDFKPWPKPDKDKDKNNSTPKPIGPDLDPKWIVDCRPTNQSIYFKWCSRYTATADSMPGSYGDVLCPGSKCLYRFDYEGTGNLAYDKACDGAVVARQKVPMNDSLRLSFKDKCAAEGPRSFPIYAIVLICLCVLAAIITIVALIWRKYQKDGTLRASRISQMGEGGLVSNRTSSISTVPTQRSILPVSRVASNVRASRLNSRMPGSQQTGPMSSLASQGSRAGSSPSVRGASSRRLSSAMGSGSRPSGAASSSPKSISRSSSLSKSSRRMKKLG